MKILLISPSFYPATYFGGPIYSTYEFAKALCRMNINIRVVTTNTNGGGKLGIDTGVFNNLENELPVKYYKSIDSRGTSLSMLFNLWKDIKEIDVIYLISIFSPPTPVTLIICKFFNKKIIITPRGQLGKWCINQGSKFKKLWLRIFIKPFIEYLNWHLTSEEEQKDVLAVYPKAKTFVIPNGIDTSIIEIREQKKDRLFYRKYSENVNENSKVIISLGRFQKVKGFDILIEAYKKVKEQVQEALLFIAGEDFGEKSNLQNLISSNNLTDKIFLVGHIESEEKINFVKNADIFALPSHHENFGMVYAEALAAGTPVVASTNTPWQDVEKFNCGKWIENTPEKFAEAIIEILSSDNIQMGKNGRKYIEDNFSWDKIAVDFIKQIKKII